MKVGDLIKLEGTHYIIVSICKETHPEILTGYSITDGIEVSFTIDDIYYWSRDDQSI